MNDRQAREAARFAGIMEDGVQLRRRVAAEMRDSVLAVVNGCEAAMRAGGRLFFCGNGGSAADAQHLACEWTVRLRGSVARPSWPAIALAADSVTMSAGGNDFGFAEVFARPLSGLGRAGDVLFGLTTSGRSPNVVRALEVARDLGMTTVGLLGGEGEPAKGFCDHVLLVPSAETARVQELHITLGHAILELLEDRLTGRT
ncbi:SIS domain-containing protein [Roseomonas gilardii subsp. gilardii]|uniref:D-sedoheptulose-7-phosphate isomerase n=1 Tax=Roseomonas gilardii TaxID=257708 RepID=UPI001FFA5963|nr:SIS domain-containing protein [Roseomonas gilardii]UPG71685.1 SIS domain-containing protein [Roseomonas gilardii subsp. gilardii]